MISKELKKYCSFLHQKNSLEKIQVAFNESIIKKINKVKENIYKVQKSLSEKDWKDIENGEIFKCLK